MGRTILIGVSDALSWVMSICDDLERQVLSASEDFRVFYKNSHILFDETSAVLGIESAVEIAAEFLTLNQVEQLLKEGFCIQSLSPPLNNKFQYTLSYRDEIPLKSLCRQQGPAKISWNLAAILKAWTQFDFSEEILGGWYCLKMKTPFADPKMPLISGDAYAVGFYFNNLMREMKLKLDGRIAVEFFRKFEMPKIPGWAWERIENMGCAPPAVCEEPLTNEEFQTLTLGKGYLNLKDLKYELDVLEFQLYTLNFYNTWELGECRFKQGLINYRLAHADPQNKGKYLYEALEAFRFVLSTEFKNSRNGRLALPRLIQECSNSGRTRRRHRLVAPTLESSEE